MVDINKIKQLRGETGVSPSEIKKALQEAGGDEQKAKELLRVWGKSLAGKKTEREVKQGIIDSYVHSNLKTGVLLDIRCESDFVAKSSDFKSLAREICLQIAAMKPLYVSENDIPAEIIDSEEKIYKEQIRQMADGKPENITKQILEGKIKKYKESISLLSQPWIKDDSKTIKNLIEETISKVGENVEVKRFIRYEIWQNS